MKVIAPALGVILTSLSLATLAAPAAVDAKAPAAANAKKTAKPITQWTCSDYLDLQESFRPTAVAWATAYGKGGKPEDTVFDEQEIETVTPELLEFCQQNPQASLYDQVKKTTKASKKNRANR